MRVLVYGGRVYPHSAFLYAVLDKQRPRPTVIISGHAGKKRKTARLGRVMILGADLLAEEWAKANNIPTEVFAADWGTFGRSAGPRRNQQMLELGKPDYAVEFPGNKGTADMRERLQGAGIEIRYAR